MGVWCFGVSGHEILLAVAVFCFAWQRRMSLGQGGVDWDGGEVLMGEREKGKKKSGFALYIIIKWKTMGVGVRPRKPFLDLFNPHTLS